MDAATLGEKRAANPIPLLLVAALAGALTLWGLTRSGFANTYYAEAAQAASRSWGAWLTNATDASLSVSLDKGPLPNMVLGLFGRVFGFSSFSLLLPEALCGVGSVLLLYDAVRRTLGRRAGLLAAAMLALTPVFVAMSRFDNPDALLVLLEVAAAWALVRALKSGRLSHVLLSAVFVGLAFNVKMLQAYLIVPALAATLLLAGQGSARRRLAHLAAGGVVMLAVSFAWYGAMMLAPAGSRPWVGDTTDNSWFSLIFGANGFGRVSGENAGGGPGSGFAFGGAPGPGGGGFGGSAGLLRLFNDIVGGQIAWLLPLAALGLGLGLWVARRAPRTDLPCAAYVLWGGWALVSWLVFSLAQGIFHPYYTTALAPAVAALAAGGLVLMWDCARSSTAWALVLGVAGIATVVLAAVLLARTSGFAPFVAPVAIVFAVLAAAALIVRSAGWGRAVGGAARLSRTGALAWFAGSAGLLAVLAGPAAYSLATVGRSLSGGNPLAGPAAVERLGSNHGGPRGLRLFAGLAPRYFAGPALLARPGDGPGSVTKALVRYLVSHQGHAKYVVAAVGSSVAGEIALQSGREAVDMGGFMGADPAPSLSKLRSLIESGQLHYVLLGDSASGRRGLFGVPGIAGRGLFGGAGIAGRGLSAQGLGSRGLFGASGLERGFRGDRSSAAAVERDSWVRAHGAVVQALGAGGGGLTLYRFA